MKKILPLIFFFLLLLVEQSFAADAACIQVIQNAKDPATGICKAFPTPCDVPSGWTKVDSCSSSDTQLEDLETKPLSANFKLQTFSSCSNMEDVMKKFIKDYYDAHPGGYGGPVLYEDMVKTDKAISNGALGGAANQSAVAPSTSASNYSTTNIQVAGVDESEIIKTDGKYIYFYDSDNHSIIIADAFPASDLKIVKTIKIPESFVSPEIYINGKKLVIMATKYSSGDFSYYWFNRSVKTVVVSYDMTDLNNLRVDKYYQMDGNLSKSRMIGTHLYVLSQSNFYFPYPLYYRGLKEGATLDQTKLNSDIDPKRLLPKKAELRYTSDKTQQNVTIKGTSRPYNVSQGYASNCSDIEYVVPDTETIKNYNFTPSYATLSIIDLADPSDNVKTKLIFGDVSEIYMSLDNLYITSGLYTPYNFSCPVIQCIKAPCPQIACSMPVFRSGQNTLIHKIGISGETSTYKASTIVPGTPLNQYSMDQSASGNFRIVTSSQYPDRYTNLFVLDQNLKPLSKLTDLGRDENFQSSRFIGDKLFLVTFQQIDPLFTIDLSDEKNPKVLGQLKIPGYSTYLHPYDEKHLIGIGYDTNQNQYGGTVNSGLKVDLYDISDINNPKQQYTATFGDQGSYSDVLNNPRLFVWDSQNKILFMPATLYTSANDKNNPYRHSDAFQGALAIKIDKDSGIKELGRVTHIDATGMEDKRKKECSQYANTTPPPCQKIIGGGEYCPPASTYVPPYCYESSPIGEYFADQIWNWSKQFVIRNLFLDNIWYTLSNSRIQANDLSDSFKKVSSVDF